MELTRKWSLFALGNLVIVAFLGIFLRYLFVDTVPGVSFKYFLHAHSHVALLGWVYLALFAILSGIFFRSEAVPRTAYKVLFYLTQISVLGMLFSFPVQGYALVSITFSTLHIFISWFFAWKYWRDYRKCIRHKEILSPMVVKFLFAGIIFMVISAIGPFSLGPIMANGGTGSNLYYLAIYFYLHFQYNGWFTLVVLGLVFQLMDEWAIPYELKDAKRIYWLMLIACVPAFALSALWTQPAGWVWLIGGFSAMLQMGALLIFLKVIAGAWKRLMEKLSPLLRAMLALMIFSFSMKIMLQLLSAIPYMADLAYKVREMIIGYLHLTLIGFISMFLFIRFIGTGAWQADRILPKAGLWLFLSGFVISEILIFLQGTMYWIHVGMMANYYHWLFWLSMPMPAGLLLFFIAQLKKAGSSSDI